ncbi:hypothetical protein CsatB_008434 [Cannabis sativa]|uniref:Uncharacterized protein n=2 Tax=Cannabis sativa TaxID=3483 RepID=A0A7J6FR31_CANSA|nr:uncharacterized protein LOC115698790 isoform X1 [Cannabis sativa]KAF4373095.1 hypothetical protein F8388_019277 [Cannabis sativa]KAF4388356.1 hypothetical protein G4B88_013193 [Cannabis sativa]
MVKDEWMRAAMSDDTLVVELLFRLKQSHAASPLKSQLHLPSTMVPLTWSVRLPRSRALRNNETAASQRKQSDSTRCSPTTPLSWSGTASPSATADGFEVEESSRSANRSPSHSRSKGIATNNDLGCNTSSSRRSRRKKTFAELKEEESSLIKEGVNLRKELEKLRATIKEQRSTNESLKRIKLEFGENSAKYVDADNPLKSAISPQPHQRITSTFAAVSLNLPNKVTDHDHPKSDSSDASKAVLDRDSFYFLPDLNSVPDEQNNEDLCIDVL